MSSASLIHEIWAKLFKQESFSAEDTFSSLKGNARLADKLYAELSAALGPELPISPTIAYDYPSINEQSAYIDGLFQEKGKSKQAFHAVKIRTGPADEPIAIIGISCRFPGGANSPEAYWNALISGKDMLEDVPASRWDIDAYYDKDRKVDGKMVTRRGGFISEHDQFDPEFFKISTAEAVFMDPNQRLALEVSWHALEQARIKPAGLKGTRTGVFVGAMFHDYEVLLERANLKNENLKYLDIGTSQAAIAGRIAYTLGLQGPAMVIDTACSSSLVALHEACQHLRQSECDIALSGGVNLMLLPEVSISFSQANMLSPDGECRSFSEDANGYVRSEGCAFLVLKRLKEAEQNGDSILAVIKGSAINQDGASGGITVPSRLAQQEVLSEALDASGLQPNDIDYFEAHGTGTPLGDPIEIGAIAAVYQGRAKPLYIGSVKSNMGHLEAAAGLAGVIKVVLALQNQKIPANLHFKKLNPRIMLDDIPAQIVTQSTDWKKEPNHVRRAAVSSYGFTGTNSHLILEEAPDPVNQKNRTAISLTVFNKKRYWPDFLDQNLVFHNQRAQVHPLLGRKFPSIVNCDHIVFQQILDLKNSNIGYLCDHQVLNTILFPAAAYIELMLSAFTKIHSHANDVNGIELKDLNLSTPLWLSEDQRLDVQTIFPVNQASQKIEIYAKTDVKHQISDKNNFWQIHAEASAALLDKSILVKPEKFEAIQKRCVETIEVSAFYKELGNQGFMYGLAFQTVTELYYSKNEFFAKITSNFNGKSYYGFPPLLDAPLQASVFFLNKMHSENDAVLYLPIGLDNLKLFKRLANICYVHARLQKTETDLSSADIVFYNEKNEVLLVIEGFHFKKIQKVLLQKRSKDRSNIESISYQLDWQALDLMALESKVTSLGTTQLLTYDARVKGVAPLDLDCIQKLLSFLQVCILKNVTNIAVQIITEQAYSLHGEALLLNQAVLNGLIKTAILEHPALHIRQVDLQVNQNWEAVFNTLESYSGDEQILAFREGQWFSQRVISSDTAQHKTHHLLIPAEGYQLIKSNNGALTSMRLVEPEPLFLKEDEVLIAPHSGALNFRDVLNAMNLYPGEPGPLGIESAGTVLSVGEKVTQFKAGDAVLGLTTGSLAHETKCNQALLVRKPEHLSFEEATCIPIVFLTAYYGLVKLAKLQPEETVLIHAGAGGVGLAAIQIAKHCKAKIIATAGSDAKRQYLKELGVDFVFDSRSTSYEADIVRVTENEGVHVVLNSLSGAGFIEASIQVTARNGRFIEMGKRNIWTVEQMAASRNDIAYHIVALDTMAEDEPNVVQQLLIELMTLFERNILKPIPFKSYPLNDAIEAFQYLQQGKNIGKVVLSLPAVNIQFSSQGSYLVTGGLGGMGLQVAKYLQLHGAGSIILLGRREPDENAIQVIKGLEENHARVSVYKLDVSDETQIENLLQEIKNHAYPLKGIFHLAGVIDDAPIDKQSMVRFEAVLQSKSKSAWVLHKLTQHHDIKLDYFVMFSSIASLLGTAGQSNYAAANGFLDALAHYRQQRGLAAQSINWGPWREVGMAKSLAGMFDRQGFFPFNNTRGIAALDYALHQSLSELGLFEANWAKLGKAIYNENPSWLKSLIQSQSGSGFIAQLESTSQNQRIDALKNMITAEARAVLRLSGNESLAPDKGFFDMGMDSMAALELKNRLQTNINQALSNTIAFDYPTVDKIHAFLCQQLQLVTTPQTEAQVRPIAGYSAEPVAIIGMACRFPGGAKNTEIFWELLASGFDSSIEIPKARWDIDRFYDITPDTPGKMIALKSSFMLEPIAAFDASFFGISPREAEYLDPQQRLLLETSWHALEDARIAPKSLQGSQTGVFIGILSHDYEDLLLRAGESEIDAYLATGNMSSTASGRISYTLGLQGPSISIDTACSSSLVALHQACQSLRLGESDMALAGGVNVMLSPTLAIDFSQAHMLSADGYCKTFDKAADGYVRGEGCGIVVLKRLSDAERDGDPILAIVKGSAVNQDGASSGLTVPNGPAQEAVIKRALAQAKLNPDDIDYIEAHGTGTALGDPIEVNALNQVFGKAQTGNQRNTPLTIGTVKTNMGHLEAAAGIAGLIKTVLALQNEKIPRHLHFHERNPKIIDFNAIPAQLPIQEIEWKKQVGHIRRAGISSFGFSGTNAHVIIEEAPDQADKQIRTEIVKTVFKPEIYWAKAISQHQRHRDGALILHPLLGVLHGSVANENKMVFEQDIDLKDSSLRYFFDHQIFNRIVFPAAGYVELMLSAIHIKNKIESGSEAWEIRDIKIHLPLKQSDENHTRIQTILMPEANLVKISIYAHDLKDPILNNGSTQWQLHAEGIAVKREQQSKESKLDLAMIKKRCTQKIGLDIFYSELASQGLQYGPDFQTLKEIMRNENEVLARIEFPLNDARYQSYPPMLDGCLQAAMCLLDFKESKLFLPVGFGAVDLHNTIETPCYVYAKYELNQADEAHQKAINLSVVNNLGKSLMSVLGFSLKETTQSKFGKILGESELTPSRCYVVNWKEISLNDIQEFDIDSNINLVTFDATIEEKDPLSLNAANRLLGFIQTIIRANFTNISVQVLTKCAYAVGDEPVLINQAILNGFIKTAILEYPELKIRQVDIESYSEIEAVLAKMESYFGPEQVLVYRKGLWYAERIEQIETGMKESAKIMIPNSDYRLTKSQSGMLEQLALVDLDIKTEGLLPDEVLIAPKAVGLNFRDVLNAMNLYPGEPGPLGGDFAGVVVSVGKKVIEYRVGDAVMGLAQGSLSSLCKTKQSLITHKPKLMSFEDAAAIPTIFMTAYYCLVHVAKLKAGETVLIHAGAGGVGLAAIQIAQFLNAKVMVTAGSETKREYLKTLGVVDILDSRSTMYKKHILDITQNQGVNVVLNSLSGAGFIEASLDCCAKNARFVEIGKRDIWTEAQLKKYREDIDYHIVALDDIAQNSPSIFKTILMEVMMHFAENHIHVIHKTNFQFTHVIEAFKYLQQAKNIGKVVVSLPTQALQFNQRATYLVTGGLGGIGLELAKYLSQQGAGRIILVSRNKPNVEANAIIEMIQDSSTQVSVYNADVSEPTQVKLLLEHANHKSYPLKGIFHAAGVIDDAPIESQSLEKTTHVFSGKATGAWYLHLFSQSLNIQLEHFVLFSSIASLNGMVAQSNYAMANSFLDALAIMRMQNNLPGLSLNWGPWREVGMAKDLVRLHQRQGMVPFKSKEAIDCLNFCLKQNIAQLGILDINWKKYSDSLTTTPSWLSNLIQVKQASAFIQDLEAVPFAQKADLIRVAIANEVRTVLGLASSVTLDPRQGFFEMGMDSLIALDLKNRLQMLLEMPLSNTLAFDYPDIETLHEHIISMLHLEQVKPAEIDNKNKIVEEVDLLSNQEISDEIDALFGKHFKRD